MPGDASTLGYMLMTFDGSSLEAFRKIVANASDCVRKLAEGNRSNIECADIVTQLCERIFVPVEGGDLPLETVIERAREVTTAVYSS
jgi:hypothetical protein